MLDYFIRGFRKIKEHPQLVSTIFIAVVIFGAFGFTVNQFAGLAIDAQDRLVNVRVGSIQDSLVPFVEQSPNGTSTIVKVMGSIANANPTITDFRLITFASGTPYITAALDKALVGTPDAGHDFIFSIARSNPANSFTTESIVDGERYYETARALADSRGVFGFLYTRQTLSEADKAVSDNIRQSILVFTAIMGLVFLLFLRHSRIIDYVALYQKLKEIDSLKDDFISMASHELRAPLTAIRGYMEDVLEAKELSSETRKYAERVDVSAKQLGELVEEMLDVSRIEQGRMKFEEKKINITEIIKAAAAMFAPLAEEKQLALVSNISGEMFIMADETRVRQVVTNLISNSIKYTLKGSVDVSLKEEKGKCVICVSDTGIGLSAEDQKRLFQKFSRIQSEETREIRGTGLGLWITKQIVEGMKGEISVESIRNVGSHFIVKFPLAK